MLKIEVTADNGDVSIGTGFHIGDGYVATARHIASNTNIRVIPHPFIGSRTRSGDDAFDDDEESTEHDLKVAEKFFVDDVSVDLAVLKTDFDSTFFMSDKLLMDRKKVDCFRLKEVWDEYFWDDQALLKKVMVMGYPAIPFSKKPFLVAVRADINAIIGKLSEPHTYLILSSTARGGFSGAPVVNSRGRVIAICTESLIKDEKIVEFGFKSAISIEALNLLLAEKEIFPEKNSGLIKRVKEQASLKASLRQSRIHKDEIV
jgi:S1-C subfamily serine protease